jgi:hypothetical protein
MPPVLWLKLTDVHLQTSDRRKTGNAYLQNEFFNEIRKPKQVMKHIANPGMINYRNPELQDGKIRSV